MCGKNHPKMRNGLYDANDSFNHVEFWEWVRKMSKTNTN
jgi:hypothetical protein